jgi:methylenetetrahydrofolate--tRNA-(uracil-5-)-methyltransferase
MMLQVACQQFTVKWPAMAEKVTVVGGGLAGSEAAWQIASRRLPVRLLEMRPGKATGAHRSGDLAELVCSNSLGSMLPDRAAGVLMAELREMRSLLLSIAEAVAVPAGRALAVDRSRFAERVTAQLESHPLIEVVREEAMAIPTGVAILASGPLTSERFSRALARLTGEAHLYFFDALAPIVVSDSIDRALVFRGSRYQPSGEGEGDYLNCPLERDEYDAFVQALLGAERIPLRDFESAIQNGVRAGMDQFFEGCLPVEIIAERGWESLAFGPMRPVGLVDPRTGHRPYAVVQLRQDDLRAQLHNMVGFQTNLKYAEQRRVFRMIPGLGEARFRRYGSMHRNTFINAPRVLESTLQFRDRPRLFAAGQICGVEGYLGNIATGLLAGVNAARLCQGQQPLRLPETTILGALCHYITHADPSRFQPMKANFGILPPLPAQPKGGRRARAAAHAARAARDLANAWPGSEV